MDGLSPEEFRRLARPVFGRSNPERIDNPLWEAVIREDLGSYALRKRFGDTRSPEVRGAARAAHREDEVGPLWCWQRFGRTRTELPDGRVVHVGGEYEDWYDPDFCIFNDVVVEHLDGKLEIYAYPLDVFPPTDFHTATLIDDAIILIGSLGYRDQRRIGCCQVARLDLATFRIDLIGCAGPSPGWVSHHDAERLGAREVLVLGGRVIDAAPDGGESADTQDRDALHALDLETWIWRRVPHGDLSIIPVSPEAWRTERSPVVGDSNPQPLDHVFKQEAARISWSPLRARLHFGDPAEKRREDEKAIGAPRPADQVVWTAERRGAADVTLANGVRLIICGEFSDHGQSWPDRWVYNDIVRFGPDGAVDVFAYPTNVMPPIYQAAAFERTDEVLVFGSVIHHYMPRARQILAFSLDLVSMAATLLDVAPPAIRAFTHQGGAILEEDGVGFRVARRTRDDPEDRLLWFSFRTRQWEER